METMPFNAAAASREPLVAFPRMLLGNRTFVEGAEAVLDFAFEGMGLEQLGARAAIENGRGNGARRKVGAVCEGVIANGLVLNGRALDQYYWTVSADDRPRRKIVWDLRTH